MPRTIIHIFHDDDASLVTGSRVASRINEVASESGLQVEVFVFGPAQAALTAHGTPALDNFRRNIDALLEQGVVVGSCINAARDAGTDDELASRGLQLEVARDAFIRFSLEGATVLTF